VKHHVWILVLVSLMTMGSDCEQERLNGLDNGLMELEDGTELRPMVLPMEVVGQEFDEPDVFYDALESMNAWFFPTDVFFGDIDEERFLELEFATDEERFGTILVSVGSLETPTWDFDMAFQDAAGVAVVRWNAGGEILFVDIILNIDYAYNSFRLTEYFIHELGHSLGFEHDGDSLDLNSCMSSPPAIGCEFTALDCDRL
jgi:hypothetical protein